MMKRVTLIATVLSTLVAAQYAAAETVRRSGSANASEQQLQQLQQLAVERDALQAKNEQLVAENDKISKELGAVKAKLENATHEAASFKLKLNESEHAADRAQETQEATVDKLKETQDRLQKVVDKYRELVEELRKAEAHGAGVQAALDQESHSLEQCTKDNQTLYQASLDLLQQYEKKGIWDAMMQHEPFTQIKRVELESIGETYRDRAEQHKFTPQADASAP